jgi:hypothetical protein
MAERGLTEPLFYQGLFNHRSITSAEMTRDQRIQYRGMYRTLLKGQPKTYQGKMKARAILRAMLYSEFPKKR